MPAQRKYDAETQERAVRMYADRLGEGDISQRAAREEVGGLLGINESTLRNWIRRDLGEGTTPAADSSESLADEVARLRRENAQLRRSNVLKRSTALWVKEAMDR